ncbi:MAG TPA: hypothetical protein VMM60_11240 [Ilumatobacter sp.]|nr:hypothetical protein [Ilumatobacter sp.]
MSIIRTRWAAVGAAIAVTLGAGGIGIVSATQPSDAVAFVPITPCRVMDTRAEFNVGPKISPLGSGEVHTVNTTTNDTGNCTDIPTTATGVSLNITATDATLPTFLTVWATGGTQPEASSLNPVPDSPPTPNAVTTGINTNGQFNIYNLQGNVQVIVDINGYYTDHHHDDRYYTKNQADDRYYTKTQTDDSYYTKSDADDRYYGFGNTLLSALTSDGASKTESTVSFPDAGSPTMTISFGLPPARDPARPILVQLPFSGPPNCSFVLSATGVAGPFSDSTRFLNGGWSVVDSPSGTVDLGPNPPGTSVSTTIVTLSHNQASDLAGGATVEMRLLRSATSVSDTCAGTVNARGGYSVEY